MTNNIKTTHYTYIIRHVNGKYYVGRRSTKKDPLLDSYMGSGRWVKSIKDRSTLTKDIISYYDTSEELKIGEMELIEKYFDDEYCMNMLYGSGGFVSGDKHPNFGKTGELCYNFGDGNGMYGRTGKLHPRFGIIHTEETKQRMSDAKSGDKHPNFGKRGELSHNYGRIHTKESKQLMGKSGENHSQATITNHIVRMIKIRISAGVKNRAIVEEYNTTMNVVKGIRSGRTWKHVTI
jgi:NUMOD3 motif